MIFEKSIFYRIFDKSIIFLDSFIKKVKNKNNICRNLIQMGFFTLSIWIYCSTDEMSETAILEVVRKNFGDHLILGEEGGFIGDTSSDYLWCIDPLGLHYESLIIFSLLILFKFFYFYLVL